MPELVPGFVKISEVNKDFDTSRKSVERRRDKARQGGNAAVYRMFRLRTKDGEILIQPSLEQVKSLRAVGRVPEWFVSRSWLRKEFGERVGETSRQGTGHPKQPALADAHAVVTVLEVQITDLKRDKVRLEEQLDNERRDRSKLLELHDKDKQRLSERSREDRQLMGQLHQLMAKMGDRLAIAAPVKTKSEAVIEGAANDSRQAPRGAKSPSTTPKPNTVRPSALRRMIGWIKG